MINRTPQDAFRWLFWAVLMLLPLVAIWMAWRDRAQTFVQTPVRNLPSYHIIKEGDVRLRPAVLGELSEQTLAPDDAVAGHYTRRALAAGRPLLKTDVGTAPESRLMADVLAVPVPASAVSVQGEPPAPGSVVSVAAQTQTPAGPKQEMVLDEALVLDVTGKDNERVFVLAVPVKSWPDYLTKTAGAKLFIAQRAQ